MSNKEVHFEGFWEENEIKWSFTMTNGQYNIVGLFSFLNE